MIDDYIEEVDALRHQIKSMQRTIKSLLKRANTPPPADIQSLWNNLVSSIRHTCNQELLRLHGLGPRSCGEDGRLDDHLWEKIDNELRYRLSKPPYEYTKCECGECKTNEEIK